MNKDCGKDEKVQPYLLDGVVVGIFKSCEETRRESAFIKFVHNFFFLP
jgi:hypothetical protein